MIHVPEEVLQHPETLEQDVDEAYLFRFLSHVGHSRALEEFYCVLLGMMSRVLEFYSAICLFSTTRSFMKLYLMSFPHIHSRVHIYTHSFFFPYRLV